MTAVEGVAARIAEALRDVPFLGPLDRDRVFAALLPVFEAELDKQAREKAAEELEKAADWLRNATLREVGGPMDVVRDLLRRASALRGEGR